MELAWLLEARDDSRRAVYMHPSLDVDGMKSHPRLVEVVHLALALTQYKDHYRHFSREKVSNSMTVIRLVRDINFFCFYFVTYNASLLPFYIFVAKSFLFLGYFFR